MFEFVKSRIDALEIDFVRWRYVAFAVSALFVVVSWLAFALIGPNWGIDFTGGTEIQLGFKEPTTIEEVRTSLRAMGMADDAVQSVNGASSNQFVIRIPDATFGMDGMEQEVRNALGTAFGPDWVKTVETSAEVSARFVVEHQGQTPYQEVGKALAPTFPGVTTAPGRDDSKVVIEIPGLAERITQKIKQGVGEREFVVLSTDAVGPKVGDDLRKQGFLAVAATLLLILIYVAFRFDIGFAPGAVLALFHDVSVTIGVFTVFQLEFNLTMIGSLLTIVGYSLNDTIVIYDRIRENRDRFRRQALPELINKSISETLTRTVATSATTLMAITAFLVMGGPVLRDFALAMFLGIIFGTYSTVYVASPMILVMEDLKPWLNRLIAAPAAAAAATPPDPGQPEGPLTESERRRRERAESEKRQDDQS